MKTKLLFTVLLALFSVNLFSQTTHKFYVDTIPHPLNTYTVADTTVEVGDVVEFINSYSTSPFVVSVDGEGVPGYTPTGSLYVGEIIYSYTFKLSDLGNMDIYVGTGGLNTHYFQNIHFTIVQPSTTGISEQNDVKFSVYPNPTTDFLNISGDNVESVKVFDMNGQLVLSDTYNSTDVKLDVTTLTNGFYTVFINDSKPIRFIKN